MEQEHELSDDACDRLVAVTMDKLAAKAGGEYPMHALEIDVGVPALNYLPDWMVLDGNHRLAAAIYARRPTILAYVGGQLDYAQRLFGVECGEVEEINMMQPPDHGPEHDDAP